MELEITPGLLAKFACIAILCLSGVAAAVAIPLSMMGGGDSFDNDSLAAAAREWCLDPSTAEKKHGSISDWDVGKVTNMSGLFCAKESVGPCNGVSEGCDPTVSQWDVGNVEDMSYMFYASSISSGLGSWNVRSVQNMSSMFEQSKFDGGISGWNVASVSTFSRMFAKNKKFNRDIRDWSVKAGADVDGMFSGATRISCDNSAGRGGAPRCTDCLCGL